MRRHERQAAKSKARQILSEGTYGVLCVAAGGDPYGVPLNYCYVSEENALFFHCSTEGRKLDMIRENPRVEFVVTGKARIAAERMTTYYESTMVFGTARLVTDEKEMKKRLVQLCKHLIAGWANNEEAFGECLNGVAVLRLDIESLSAKTNAERA